MPSMREHYNTDGIRISTTAISFFLHHLPHANPTTPPASAAFFCAFMGENWKTEMAENWEVGDKYSTVGIGWQERPQKLNSVQHRVHGKGLSESL